MVVCKNKGNTLALFLFIAFHQRVSRNQIAFTETPFDVSIAVSHLFKIAPKFTKPYLRFSSLLNKCVQSESFDCMGCFYLSKLNPPLLKLDCLIDIYLFGSHSTGFEHTPLIQHQSLIPISSTLTIRAYPL